MASSSTSEIDTDWYGEFDWPKRENFLPKIEEEDMTNSSTNHFDGEDESSNLKVVSKKKTSRMDILKACWSSVSISSNNIQTLFKLTLRCLAICRECLLCFQLMFMCS